MSLRVPIMLACLLLPGISARADAVILRNGQLLEGELRDHGTHVDLRLREPYPVLRSFDRDDIQWTYIGRGNPARQYIAQQLANAGEDIQVRSELARWAERHGKLPNEALRIRREILAYAPDHEPTRRAMGHVKWQDRWQAPADMLAAAETHIGAGDLESAIDDTLPLLLEGLENASPYQPQLEDFREDALRLLLEAQLSARRFRAAVQTAERLAERLEEPESARFEAIASLLRRHPDGMVILRESYPTDADLFDHIQRELRPGPASLADPRVLQASLRRAARQEIRQAREAMELACQAMPDQPQVALVQTRLADRILQRAEAMTRGITDFDRPELSRLRIRVHRALADRQAREFDRILRQVEESDGDTTQPTRKRLLDLLDSVELHLRAVDRIAVEDPSSIPETSLTRTKQDLIMIQTLRLILQKEFQ